VLRIAANGSPAVPVSFSHGHREACAAPLPRRGPEQNHSDFDL